MKVHFSLNKLKDAYQIAKKRLLILDYDGTLMPFTTHPKESIPDATLIELLSRLKDNKKNTIAVVSGRSQEHLDEIFGDMDLILAAEHGGQIRIDKEWQNNEIPETKWITRIHEIMQPFVDRNSRSHIEEKKFSIGWHFREVTTDILNQEKRKLLVVLKQNLPPNTEILRGNKLIEVRDSRINKGLVAKELLKQDDYDFILCAGDDTTDEDMFKIMPKNAWTFKIRDDRLTSADYIIGDHDEFRQILGSLEA